MKPRNLKLLTVVCTLFSLALFLSALASAQPTYSNISASSSTASSSCTFYATFNDSSALNPNGQVIFGSNNTGSWDWSSPLNFTSTPETTSVTLTLDSNVGDAVAFMWNFTNNAGEASNTSLQLLTITAPTSTPTATPISSTASPFGVNELILLIVFVIFINLAFMTREPYLFAVAAFVSWIFAIDLLVIFIGNQAQWIFSVLGFALFMFGGYLLIAALTNSTKGGDKK